MKTFIVKSNGKSYNVKAKDAQHAAKLVKLLQKDARRINYDDDIIKVTLNGKEVYKGMAEDWVDDDFYKNFKWTGSQYEASNAKGKWVVKVLDSKTTTKDAASAREVIQQLIDDEASATAAYNIAIKNLTGELDEQSIAVLRAIRDDEERHSENLFAIMSGNVTEKNLQDAINPTVFASGIRALLNEIGAYASAKSRSVPLTQDEALEIVHKIQGWTTQIADYAKRL